MPVFDIVGERFTPEGFRTYLNQIRFDKGGFRPTTVTLHHTAMPSLADRPNGFSSANMTGFQRYYGITKGWRSGPHLFVDDHGIWVLTPLHKKGVHAVSFNKDSWGLEMLGFYDVESFNSGRGARVRQMSVEALAACFDYLGTSETKLRFHRDDPETKKTCPGKNVQKLDMIARIALARRVGREWVVRLPNGKPFTPVKIIGGRPCVPARLLATAIKPGIAVSLGVSRPSGQSIVSLNYRDVPLTQIKDNVAWVSVRDAAAALNLGCEANGATRIVSLVSTPPGPTPTLPTIG